MEWNVKCRAYSRQLRVCMQFFRKKAKYLKIWAKMCKICECFEKGQSDACDYCMYETARICPEM